MKNQQILELMPYIRNEKKCTVIKGLYKGTRGMISKINYNDLGNIFVEIKTKDGIIRKLGRNINLLNTKIPQKRYISIGSYVDNNDGIYYYYPEVDNKESWKIAFSESYIISFLLIAQFYFNDLDDYEYMTKCVKSNFKKYLSSIQEFLNKYYLGDSGMYREGSFFHETIWFHTGKPYLEEYFYNIGDKIHDLRDKYFIIDSEYEDFIEALNNLIPKLFE